MTPVVLLLRAAPLCAVLPLPGLAARAALAVVLTAAAWGAPAVEPSPIVLLRELARGLFLGLGVATPLYAVRWAGGLIGQANGRDGDRPTALVAGTLGWVIFSSAGGTSALVRAYLGSYARWPVAAPVLIDPAVPAAMARLGTECIALVAGLALPALCVLSLVELAGGLLARYERVSVLDANGTSLARTARPVVVALLLTGSAAAFTQAIGAAAAVNVAR